MATDDNDQSTEQLIDPPPQHAIDLVKAEVTALAITPDYKIQSGEEAQGANDALATVKVLIKRLAEAKDAERRPLNEELKRISGKYIEAEIVLEEAERTLKRSLIAFKNAEEKRIAEERRIANEAALKERARLEEEARVEREKAEAKAAKLREQGKDERADAVQAAAESSSRAKETLASLVAAPIKPPEATKLAGASFRKVWKAKVVDMPKFLKALADSHYPIAEFVEVNQAALDRLAKSLQGNMDKALPGTIAWEDEVMGSRSR
jgi:hypothetical protein